MRAVTEEQVQAACLVGSDGYRYGDRDWRDRCERTMRAALEAAMAVPERRENLCPDCSAWPVDGPSCPFCGKDKPFHPTLATVKPPADTTTQLPGYKIVGALSPEAATQALRDAGVIVDFIDPKDLAKFKDLLGFAMLAAINLPETDPRRVFIRQGNELLALIDGQK